MNKLFEAVDTVFSLDNPLNDSFELKESTGLNVLEYLNEREEIKETIKEKIGGFTDTANGILKRIAREFDSKLDSQDAEVMKEVGGWWIKDLHISEPSYDTSKVVNSSFSEYIEYKVSCVAALNGKDSKDFPIEFDYKEIYNSYSGGWN